jgi:2-keto-3-deoxy-L-rhamnonate aldolase RhmA
MGLSRHDYADHPQHLAAMSRIVAATRAARKIAGCNTYSLDDAQAKQRDGFDFITLRSEVDLFLDAAKDLWSNLQTVTTNGGRE